MFRAGDFCENCVGAGGPDEGLGIGIVFGTAAGIKSKWWPDPIGIRTSTTVCDVWSLGCSKPIVLVQDNTHAVASLDKAFPAAEAGRPVEASNGATRQSTAPASIRPSPKSPSSPMMSRPPHPRQANNHRRCRRMDQRAKRKSRPRPMALQTKLAIKLTKQASTLQHQQF